MTLAGRHVQDVPGAGKASGVSGDQTATLVLPRKERFGPLAAGAVVRRLAGGGSRCRSRVVGPAFDGPVFPGIEFLPVAVPAWLPATPTRRYALSVAMRLRSLPLGPIEVHNKPDVAMVPARLFPGRPVILFLHNDPRTMRGANSPRLRARIGARLAQVVTVSDFVRRCFLHGATFVAPPGPEVIHNAISCADLPPVTPQAQRDRLILFAGRIVEEKAPDAFVASCAAGLPRLPGWRAEMYGAAGFSAAAPDSAFIRRLRPAAAGVLLHGYRPHAEVLQALARAAIAVVPSRWEEPFGLSALEAMACGAAVTCSNRGGLAEVTGDAAVAIGTAEILVGLADSFERRSGLATLAQRRVRTCFSIEGAVGKLDALRDRVIAAAGTG